MYKKYINKIIKGDTLEILKKLPSSIVDLGITSPPYNKGENKKGWLVKNVKYSNSIDKVSEKKYQQKQIEVLNEIYRITKVGGSFFYNHKLRWERGNMFHPMSWLSKTNWHIRQEIIWNRIIAANIRGWRFWQIDERIYWLYKPKNDNLIGDELKSKHSLLTSIWKFPPERNNPHPAPFPLIFPTRIIHSIMDDKNGLIFDPYCGSGTTLVSAKLLGKKFLGIDIADDYINISKKRLAECKKELDIVKKEIKIHIVKKTFKDRKNNGEFTGKYKKTNNNENNS